MGSTARGLRFPEPTDRLNQVAQFIEDLAEDVTTELGEVDTALAGKAPKAQAARVRSTTAGSQAGPGTVYVAAGFTWSAWASLVSVTRRNGSTFVDEPVTVIGHSGDSGVIYLGGIGAGVPDLHVVVVDPVP